MRVKGRGVVYICLYLYILLYICVYTNVYTYPLLLLEEPGGLEIGHVHLHQRHEAEGEAEAREEGVPVQVPAFRFGGFGGWGGSLWLVCILFLCWVLGVGMDGSIRGLGFLFAPPPPTPPPPIPKPSSPAEKQSYPPRDGPCVGLGVLDVEGVHRRVLPAGGAGLPVAMLIIFHNHLVMKVVFRIIVSLKLV